MTECEGCGVDITPVSRLRGRPAKTCGGAACKKALRAKYAHDRKERMKDDLVLQAKHHGAKVKYARKQANIWTGDWRECVECGEPVDCTLLGPEGYFENGTVTHGGLDRTCMEGRHAARVARDKAEREAKAEMWGEPDPD